MTDDDTDVNAVDCYEGNLDVQYIMGVAQQTATIYWYVLHCVVHTVHVVSVLCSVLFKFNCYELYISLVVIRC